MSTPSATARYVIAAEDKTGAATRSIVQSFKSMDREIRGTAKTLNSVIGIAIGVQLTQALGKVVDVTAKSAAGQKGFATALREVRDAATDLLAAKSGLPEATAQMRELRDILKDPAVVAAADSITSVLIAGFTKASKAVGETIAGIRELTKTPTVQGAKTRQDVIDALSYQIDQRRAELQKKQFGNAGGAEWDPSAGDFGSSVEIANLKREIAQLEAAQQRVFDNPYRDAQGHGAPFVPSFETRQSVIGNSVLQADEARRKKLQQEIDVLETSSAATEGRVKQLLLSIDQDLPDNDVLKKMREEIELIDINAIEARKVVTKELSVISAYADEAARNMQSAFADFLFDPFQNGLKGMLKGFVDVVRRMVAEMAAAKIFGSKASGGAGLGDFLSGIFNSFGSSASGEIGPVLTSVLPKYATGTDSVPRTGLAIVHQGERIIPASQNRGGMGITFAPVYNISATGGASEALVLAAAKRASDDAVARVIDINRRGGLG